MARANDSPFGLAGGVFTQNLARANRSIAQLNAGQVYVNTYNLAPVEVPWGGWQGSGFGRENGTEAVHYWTQTKTIHVEGDGLPLWPAAE